MPYKTVWYPPALFVEHKGVTVYHAYKSTRHHPLYFWFHLSAERDAKSFDVRTLSTWPKKDDKGFDDTIDRKAALIAAIDSGEIHRVEMREHDC